MTSLALFPYYIKQVDSMLPSICSIIDHRRHQYVVRTSVTQSPNSLFATFLFLPHFDIIHDLLLNRCTATWNLFIKLSLYRHLLPERAHSFQYFCRKQEMYKF